MSPYGTLNESTDSDPVSLYSHFMKELSKRNILFVDCIGDSYKKGSSIHEKFRSQFNGVWVANGGLNQETGSEILKDGNADMVSYATLALPNEDLPQKFEKGTPLNKIDYADPNQKLKLLYGPGKVKEGYLDLTPFLPKKQ